MALSLERPQSTGMAVTRSGARPLANSVDAASAAGVSSSVESLHCVLASVPTLAGAFPAASPRAGRARPNRIRVRRSRCAAAAPQIADMTSFPCLPLAAAPVAPAVPAVRVCKLRSLATHIPALPSGPLNFKIALQSAARRPFSIKRPVSMRLKPRRSVAARPCFIPTYLAQPPSKLQRLLPKGMARSVSRTFVSSSTTVHTTSSIVVKPPTMPRAFAAAFLRALVHASPATAAAASTAARPLPSSQRPAQMRRRQVLERMLLRAAAPAATGGAPLLHTRVAPSTMPQLPLLRKQQQKQQQQPLCPRSRAMTAVPPTTSVVAAAKAGCTVAAFRPMWLARHVNGGCRNGRSACSTTPCIAAPVA